MTVSNGLPVTTRMVGFARGFDQSTRQILFELEARDLVELADRIAKQHDVTLLEMLGHTRGSGPSWARQALWSELYARGHWSYPRLGKLFDRNHRTIMAGVDAHLRRTGAS